MSESGPEARAGGYTLPASLRLGAVRLQVSDLQESIEYYTNTIGLRLHRKHAALAVLGTSRHEEPLVELVQKSGVAPVPPRGRLGLYHFALLLPDRPSLARFALHLAEQGVRVGTADHLVSEAFYLQDPDGLGVEVYADRPQSTWEMSGGELRMDTLPLDVNDLVTEAGDEAWDGVPVGTSVGHVHLHVGALDEAADFYRHGLGFTPTVAGFPGALFLSAGGYHHHLGLNTWAAGKEPAGEEDARMLEWRLQVPGEAEAREAARSLQSRGYSVSQQGDGWRAQDPWGVGVIITADSAVPG